MKYVPFYWWAIAPRMKKALYKKYSHDSVDRLMKKAKPIYKELLKEMHGMSPANPMATYIYMPFTVLAVWLASERKIRPESMSEVLSDVIDWPLMKRAAGLINMNTKLGVKLFGGFMHMADNWTKRHPEDTNTWDFHFDETLHRDGFYYHFTYCPLYAFCREHGYEEINRVLCGMDFQTMSMMHSRLIREQTISGGGDKCDYWTIGDKITNPQ